MIWQHSALQALQKMLAFADENKIPYLGEFNPGRAQRDPAPPNGLGFKDYVRSQANIDFLTAHGSFSQHGQRSRAGYPNRARVLWGVLEAGWFSGLATTSRDVASRYLQR